MKKKVYNIYVSKKDITAARKDANGFVSETCPVAQAIKRRPIFDPKTVDVGPRRFCANKKTFKLPPAVSKFIDSFDSKKDVKPFSFRIYV